MPQTRKSSPSWPLRNTGAEKFAEGDRVNWTETNSAGEKSGTYPGTVRAWPTTNNHRFVAVMLDSRSGPYYTGGKKLILALPRELERL